MSHYNLVAINNKERERLEELGLDPQEFKAMESSKVFKTMINRDNILPGVRGGLINNRTMLIGDTWVDEGSIALNSILCGEVLDESYVASTVCTESTMIKDAKVLSSNISGKSRIFTSDVTNTYLDAGSIYESTITNGNIKESHVNEVVSVNTKLNKSSIYRTNMENGEIENSRIWDTKVEGRSYINHVTANDAELIDVNLSHTVVANARLGGAILSESTIRNTIKPYTKEGHAVFYDSEIVLSDVDTKFIERGWAVDYDEGRYDYTKGDDKIIITDEGVTTSLADYDRAAVIPLDMIDLVAEKAREISQKDLTLSEDDLLDLEEGVENTL